ncbi:DUF7467 domain-containing protein [Halomontanus rarus]|uniref:DUF7467 domain-containing protein n=1 Tax=Halomontanus rarus TaxID=3034020 RepID=UPI0023E8626D|nr:hypothetical protein [Halovivax sp. TS33]
MSERPNAVTRRQLLASVGGVGAFGAIGGARTHALLTDTERFSMNPIGTGEIALTVDCDRCYRDGNAVGFSFAGIEPGDTGRTTIELDVETNPARLWMRTDCPPLTDPLGAVLEVDLWIDHDCDGDRDTNESLLFSGTLTDLRRELTRGLRLDTAPRDDSDGPCLPAGTPLCLGIGWRFPAENVEGLVGLSSELRFDFFAEQCRHVDEGDVTNPFASFGECPDLECSDCLRLGKADIDGDSVEPGDVFALETDDHVADDYTLEVLSVTNKGDGDSVCASVRLLRNGSEDRAPPMCSISVFGGGAEIDTAIDPPSTRTYGEICTPEITRGRHGRVSRPAISHVTVFVCPLDSLEQCVVCDADQGAVRRLTVEYVGEENREDGEVTITVTDRGGPDCGFLAEVTASPGTVFDVDASEAGKQRLCANTVFDIDDSDSNGSYELHTSCSEPLGPETEIHDETGNVVFRVVSGTTASGLELCAPEETNDN